MGQYFNVGNAGFASVAKRNYVDKTGLIEYINSTLGTSEKLTCVSRPRRFGKSFAAKMLCAYYDKSCDSRALFEERDIAKSAEFEKHLNQYNVIYIDLDLDGLKESIMDMLCGKAYKINSRTFQNDMTTIKSKDDVLTLLVHLGYLAYNATEETVVIPNEEVRQEFLNAIENGNRKELIQLIKTSDQLLADTIAMKENEVAAAIQEAHSIGTAPLFYNNEQALRSVIRFSYIAAIDDYQIIQELPSGNGYADMVFIPKKASDKPAMVVELKWNQTANAAISQIKDNNYPEVLKGMADSVLLVAINYDKKTKEHTCVIEKWALE